MLQCNSKSNLIEAVVTLSSGGAAAGRLSPGRAAALVSRLVASTANCRAHVAPPRTPPPCDTLADNALYLNVTITLTALLNPFTLTTDHYRITFYVVPNCKIVGAVLPKPASWPYDPHYSGTVAWFPISVGSHDVDLKLKCTLDFYVSGRRWRLSDRRLWNKCLWLFSDRMCWRCECWRWF